MKKFTIKGITMIIPILAMVLSSATAFSQVKKAHASSVTITFRVDMTYQKDIGAFNPFTDTLDIPGTMNNWSGSPRMNSTTTPLVYELAYTVDSGTIQEYKFRINGDWATSEFPNGGPNRMYLVPGNDATVTSIYDDYQPGTVPVTFKCHMAYQIMIGNFDKSKDYLDIAGTMNSWGAYDVMFDRGNDSVYVINLNIDTMNIVNVTPIEFKFRINGDWATSEFPDGGANRLYRVEDTTNGYKNIVDVWYNDEDPAIPAPPLAMNVKLQGNLTVGETLTGSYSYYDINGDPEGNSHYNWYRADSLTQPEAEEIIGVMSVNYVVTEADLHKYIAFQVTPVSATGDPNVGNPVRLWTDTFVAGLGFEGSNKNSTRFYPNPAGDNLFIESSGNIEKIEIYNLVGTNMISLPVSKTGKISVNISSLHPGVYFIKIQEQGNGLSTSKFIKK